MTDYETGIAFIVRNKHLLLEHCAGPSEAYVVEQTIAALSAPAGCVAVKHQMVLAANALVPVIGGNPVLTYGQVQGILEAALAAAPAVSDLPTDDELPGMWSRADLIRGETDAPPHVEITTFNNGICEVTAYKLEDGKYEIRSADNGAVVAFRYGENWRDLTGDKLIGALLAAMPKPKAKP